MSYIRVNSKTIVLDNGKNAIITREKENLEKLKSAGNNYLKEKKNRNAAQQLQLYKTFLRMVFEDRDFITTSQFNKLITERFNANSTHYRNAMIKRNLITEKNFIIRLVNSKSINN